MQDRLINNARPALRKQLIRESGEGLSHSEELLRTRGVVLPASTNVAGKERMGWMLRDRPALLLSRRIAQIYAVEKGRGDRRRAGVSRFARRRRRRSSTGWKAGCTTNCLTTSDTSRPGRGDQIWPDAASALSLDHGVPELDDNTGESAMRSVAIARQTDLLVGSQTGGRAAAIADPSIETVTLHGADPQWRADTRARIPDDEITRVDDLLPRNRSNHAA